MIGSISQIDSCAWKKAGLHCSWLVYHQAIGFVVQWLKSLLFLRGNGNFNIIQNIILHSGWARDSCLEAQTGQRTLSAMFVEFVMMRLAVVRRNQMWRSQYFPSTSNNQECLKSQTDAPSLVRVDDFCCNQLWWGKGCEAFKILVSATFKFISLVFVILKQRCFILILRIL